MTEETTIPKEEKALAKITTYMDAPIVKARFASMLGGEQGASTYISSVLIAVANSPKLQECAPASIYTSALRAATLRLSVDPGIGQAYIVPYGRNANLIVGYKGLHDMAVRTGKYRYINVGPIYEGEEAEEDRITGFHSIVGHKASAKAKVIGWLGAFELFTGYAKTLYMSVEEIHEHAEKYSQSYHSGPWKTETAKMERKTVLRLMLRRWGYMDPADVAVLDVIESTEQTVDGQVEDISTVLAQREPDDGEPKYEDLPDESADASQYPPANLQRSDIPAKPAKRSREQNLKELGF